MNHWIAFGHPRVKSETGDNAVEPAVAFFLALAATSLGA